MPGFVYFAIAWAIREHDTIIQKTGGLLGVPKEGELDGLLQFIKDDGYYETFEAKLSHLIFSLVKNHYFVDGNKRSSIAIGAYFLEVNGYGGIVPRFIPDMENVVLCVADDIISKTELHSILSDITTYGEMSESNKLLMLHATEEYQRKEAERNKSQQQLRRR